MISYLRNCAILYLVSVRFIFERGPNDRGNPLRAGDWTPAAGTGLLAGLAGGALHGPALGGRQEYAHLDRFGLLHAAEFNTHLRNCATCIIMGNYIQY